MKVITRAVLDWDGNVLEESSFEYRGPIAAAKSSGSAPAPTNPYEQAAAQYGLATGTADYNAALNRTGSVNPLGESGWSVTGTDGTGNSSFGGYPTGFNNQNGEGSYPQYGSYPMPASNGMPQSSGVPQTMSTPNGGSPSFTGIEGSSGTEGTGNPYGLGGSQPAANGGTGAPLYTQQTSLDPWANQLLSSPIDTSQIPGMPGGPSLEQNVNSAENATYAQEMQLLQPQEQLQSEQTQAQLEGEGAMPGSAAYGTGEQMLGLQQGQENTQAANQAVTTGMGELPMFYGLGSTDLQNQLAERNAPISEFESLQGNGGGNVSAATPDISGAFGQQYSGALAGYNANTATNNANTQAGTSLASMIALAALM